LARWGVSWLTIPKNLWSSDTSLGSADASS
jgi:hypothetical protein